MMHAACCGKSDVREGGAAMSSDDLLLLGMGGTIDKDYPRSTKGYAFEIDEVAAARVLEALPFFGLRFSTISICRKDSTEIDDADRQRLVEAVRRSSSKRVVVTHGTDTLLETAQWLASSGAAAGKAVVLTGAMKPERFKDSDACFNLGAAVGATAVLPAGAVYVTMGGRVVDAARCRRDLETGMFVDADEPQK